MKTRKAILYTRVSTAMQVDGYSLDAQKAEVENNAKLGSYKIVETFSDAGKSGKSLDRSGFQDLIQKIESDDSIEAVVVWKMSRISRSIAGLSIFMQFLENNKVDLVAVGDRIDTSRPGDKLLAHILGVLSEFERDNIIENSKIGSNDRAKKGSWNGGVVYGYDSKDKVLIINDNEASVIKKIFQLYANEDYGYQKICKYLNANGIKTKKGNTWAYSSIKTILDNPLYIGKIRYGVHKNWSDKRRKGISSDYILTQGNHEAIINQDLWNKVRDKRRMSKSNKKIHADMWLLTGLIKCPECGASMVSHRTTSNGKKNYYYICSQYANKGISVCHSNLVRRDDVEEEVVKKLFSFISRDGIVDAISNAIFVDEDKSEDFELSIKRVEKNIEKINSKRKELYLMRLNGRYDEKTLNELDEDITTELNEAEKILNSLYSKKRLNSQKQMSLDNIQQILKNFDELWNSIECNKVINDEEKLHDKKRLINTIFESVHVNKSNDINDRSTVKEMSLHFSEMDLVNHISGLPDADIRTCVS